jgi:flagellin
MQQASKGLQGQASTKDSGYGPILSYNGTDVTVGIATGAAATDVVTLTSAGIDGTLKEVSATRATLGAGQNRLESMVNNLTTLSDARSRIEDASYSDETTALAKAQILSQASTAMIAQGNQSQQNVLSLLR